jgi:DNA-binding transcriptional MerR regulator
MQSSPFRTQTINAVQARQPKIKPRVAETLGLPGISEVALEFGMTARALRFYEARGLINPIRTGQHRHYTSQDRFRLGMILKAKQLGFRLSEIATMIGQADPDGKPGELALTAEQVSEQIRQLEDQHRAIDRALGELRRRLYLMAEVGEQTA